MNLKSFSWHKLITNTFYLIFSFGLIYNGHSSFAGLKEMYSSQENTKWKCNSENGQYIRHGFKNLHLCIMNNVLYIELKDNSNRPQWLGQIGKSIPDSSKNKYEFAIEGNEIIKYKCHTSYANGPCKGDIKREIYGKEKY